MLKSERCAAGSKGSMYNMLKRSLERVRFNLILVANWNPILELAIYHAM